MESKKYARHAERVKKAEEVIVNEVIGALREKMSEGKKGISLADLNEAKNAVAEKSLQQLAQAGGEGAFFSLVGTSMKIDDAFYETFLMQAGRGEALCGFLIPEKAHANAANLADLAAKECVEERRMDMDLIASRLTRTVTEARAVGAEIYYLLSVGQAFSARGNREYQVGGALICPPPPVSENVADKVMAAYNAVRVGKTEDGRSVLNDPELLLTRFKQAISKALTATEKVEFDRFYNQGLTLLTEHWRRSAS